ncbi:sulfite exporter TauE/SafE family protein [Phenylobacterium sp.]|uniref:sulfite exporter TauE/SafE family protein n=1 Tax=Phenylobacterium sp. TaxID=1871053 RepID=UPI0027308ECC|nr:sulfite exporter TauE/SafE family protein [Phenylobacterium sp.]MDP1599881.1 sulfite exporter TauE/SafE family protein [Phenylobacterium sp.]MDP3591155.1 sulfite exporter TauE/SafE family protein [Phenylobacterium sp.]
MGPEFWLFAAVGFAAQLVDGALGMAYGVVSTTVLLANGVPPATASASVHAAKVFTGAASAVSHIAHRNVDWRLLVLLAAGGMLGGVVGTYLLTSVDGEQIKPFVVAWLGLMGLVILYRAWKGARPKPFSWKGPFPLGLVGGFFDAVGGGGWGPVVTSTLLGSGADPRKAIGTTNAAEAFVAAAVSAAFLAALVSGHWETDDLAQHLWSVLGLIAGGVVAAPLAGWMTKVLPIRALTWIVGLVVTGLAIWQAVVLFG